MDFTKIKRNEINQGDPSGIQPGSSRDLSRILHGWLANAQAICDKKSKIDKEDIGLE